MVSITVYDGAETIGGNKIFVDGDGHGYFLDFGKNFSKYGQYYKDFLQARDTRGIHDPLTLDLLPRIQVYRDDLLPADAPPLSRLSAPVVAAFISHAHMDHCGHVGMLDDRVPLIATPTTASILKGMQDCGSTTLDGSMAYISTRVQGEDPRRLKAASKTAPYEGKNFQLTAPPPDRLREFLGYRAGSESPRTKKICAGECCCYLDQDLPFTAYAFEVDHSIYGAAAFVINDETTIAYTGDIRFHGQHDREATAFLDKARDASVLIMEGTNAGDDPAIVPTTEQAVAERSRAVVESAPGLVIADFSARNFERLESFRAVAERAGRELVVPSKDYYMLRALECADGACYAHPGLRVYKEVGSDDRTNRKWESEMMSGASAGLYIDPEEIRNDPGRFLLCFSFYDMKHLLDIKPDAGTYIYSACEAFNEEMAIDFRRLWTWLMRFNFTVHGFSCEPQANGVDKLDFDPGFHASGHAGPADLARIVDRVDPDHLIPVHTDSKDWFVEQFENVVVMRDGETRAF